MSSLSSPFPPEAQGRLLGVVLHGPREGAMQSVCSCSSYPCNAVSLGLCGVGLLLPHSQFSFLFFLCYAGAF